MTPLLVSTSLSNGVKVFHRLTPNDPVSAAHLFLPIGAAWEPVNKGGLSALMWASQIKATHRRNARQLAEDIEALGAHVGGGATQDYSEFSCHAISEYFTDALRIMSEVLLTPSFPENEVEKEKEMLLAAIESKKESLFTVTNELMNHHLFENHPYGRPASGTQASVKSLSVNDLKEWHSFVVNPSQAILSIASNVSLEKLLPLLESLLGASTWTKTSQKNGHLKMEPSKGVQKQVSIQSSSEFEQAYLMMAYSAPSIRSEEYFPLKVISTVLGGGMSTRLFQALREKEGLAYDVGMFYPSRLWGSALVVHLGLQYARLEEAKIGVLKQLDLLLKTGVSPDELQQIKNYLKGSYLLDHQTNSQRAHYVGWWEVLGLGADYDTLYVDKVEQVTTQQVRDLAHEYFSKPFVSIETIPKNKDSADVSFSHAT